MASLTLRELIAELQALPESALDLEVKTEGCDCIGDAGSVEVSNGYVMIFRAGKAKPAEPEPAYEPSDKELEYRAKGLLPE